MQSSEKRLSLTPSGNVRYELKTPYRNGTTHVTFEPLDCLSRLAALVPKARVDLTRFHGVLAPNSAHRARVTSAKRGTGNKANASEATEGATPAERRAAMAWSRRVKRVFNIDICKTCGGHVKVAACIEDSVVIESILAHLDSQRHFSPIRADSVNPAVGSSPGARAMTDE